MNFDMALNLKLPTTLCLKSLIESTIRNLGRRETTLESSHTKPNFEKKKNNYLTTLQTYKQYPKKHNNFS